MSNYEAIPDTELRPTRISTPTRRDFFKGAGLLIGFAIADATVPPQLFGADTIPAPSPTRLDAWLRIEKDGTIQVFTGKVDIGMGVGTALKQIVAEEMDVAPSRVFFVMGDTAATPDQGGVGGSTSISSGAKPLRNAAATARFLLVQMASAKLGVPVDDLGVKDGVIIAKSDASKSVTYAALTGSADLNDTLKVSGAGFGLNAEGKGKPKDPSTYTVVGQSIHRDDLTRKILGRGGYSTDIRMPGMLHGRLIRPNAVGAAVQSVDDAAAKQIHGYVKTVVQGNFVGVVADSEWGAIKAAKAVKVNWGPPPTAFPDDVYAHLRSAKPKATREGMKRGDANAAFQSAAGKVNASYEWPSQAHATMGPGCAVADVHMDGVTTVWCGAQKPHALQMGLAEMLKVPPSQVRIIWVEDAGSYGRAGYEDVAADAALLSAAVGKPVRVQWSREDMTAWGGKGPAAVMDLSAALNAQGDVTGLKWTSRLFSGTEILPQPNAAGNMLAAQLTGTPNTSGGDEFVHWGGDTTAYKFANVHSESSVIPALYPLASPMRHTHLRDPNGPAGTFAGESFIDELAAAAKADPIDFRMKWMEDPRQRAVLKAAADKFGWDSRPSPRNAASGDVVTGRGIALALRGATHVATVAEVEVNRRTGDIKVTRFVCAHDCGLIVNPDGVKATVAANLIQSMSRAMKEEVRFDHARVTTVDWNTYPVARWSDIPTIDVVLINHTEIAPSGAGEPSSRGTAAAIANAVFDATGVRLRRVPLKMPPSTKA